MTFFCYEDEGGLRGSLILLKEIAKNISLTRGKVVDLFVENDEPKIVDALFRSAFSHAKEEGCQLFEGVGFRAAMKGPLKTYRPLSRTLPTFPFHFVANTPELKRELHDIDNWYPSLFDGDSWFYSSTSRRSHAVDMPCSRDGDFHPLVSRVRIGMYVLHVQRRRKRGTT